MKTNNTMEKEFKFKVKTIEAGQKREHQDRFYHYEVTSKEPEFMVRGFCNLIKKSYKKEDMPNPFAGELMEFKNITDHQHPDNIVTAPTLEDTYCYKVRKLCME